MPSFSSFLPTRQPGEGALDEEAGDALVPLRGVDGGHDDEQLGLGGVGDPQLPPGEGVVVSLVLRPAGQGEGVGSRVRLAQGVGAHPLRGQLRVVPRLLLVVPPAQERVVDEGVLDVHQHRQRGVHAGELLDGEDRHEERRRRAPVLLGDLDPHQPELEARVDEVAGKRLVLVHLVDDRSDLRLGEVADEMTEAALFLGEIGQGQAAAHFAHGVTSASSYTRRDSGRPAEGDRTRGRTAPELRRAGEAAGHLTEDGRGVSFGPVMLHAPANGTAVRVRRRPCVRRGGPLG